MDFLNQNAKYKLLADNVPRIDYARGGFLQNPLIVYAYLQKEKTNYWGQGW